ncbi:hypothetical protein [Parasphingorhabdus sp.]|uniref:hypothetical protein n=1 Tax=Parasphingorhabdus sp. TaxID=2709688 RepID=UPI003A916007
MRRQITRQDQARGSHEFPSVIASVIIALLVYLLTDLSIYSSIGVGLTIYALIQYVEALGKSAAILQMTLLIAVLQLILGPIISYQLGTVHTKYRMYVPEQTYMPFAVSGMLAFALGLKVFKSNIDIKKMFQNIQSYKIPKSIPYLFIFIGITSNVASSFVPSAIAFVFFLFGQFQFIAICYLFATRSRSRWTVGALVMVVSFFISAEEGVFHNIILWAGLIFSFVCMQARLTRLQKYAVLAVGAFALSSLQSVKADFRDELWSGQVSGSAGLVLIAMMGGGDRPEEVQGVSQLEKLNIRLNQGWVVSAVMQYVPQSRPFAGGATIKDAVADSLLPRFLFAKREVLVGDAFREYTGLPLGGSTSIGIGLLGEAWANYGWWGWVLMGAWGAVLSGTMALIVRYSKYLPTLVLWSPFLFLMAIKAETELAMTLNYLLKSSVFLALLYGLLRRVFGIKF